MAQDFKARRSVLHLLKAVLHANTALLAIGRSLENTDAREKLLVELEGLSKELENSLNVFEEKEIE